MTEEIKSRLEQIRAGKVPEGYIKTKAGIMPADWNMNKKAKEVFKSHTDKKHSNGMEILAATQENGIVPRSQIDIDIKCSDEGISGYKKVDAGDFIISLRSFQGGIEYSPYRGIVSPAYTVLKPIVKIADEYYKNYFKTESFISRLNGAVYGIRDGKQIGYEDFGDLIIHNPPLPEQQKIAEILMQCDKVITLKKERIEEEKKRKKWLMGRLLCQNYDADSPIGKYQKWKRVRLQEICFMKSGESITAKSINEIGKYPCFGGNGKRGYTDTYTHNGSYILIGRQGALCGNVTRVSGFFYASEHAIVTQAKNIDQSYLYFLLCDMKLNRRSESSAQPGLSVEKVLRMYVNIPTAQNYQALVGRVLSCADNTIRILEVELAQWQQKKKALMQLLLTGIVRVK